jgi:hypothetical protein
MIVQVRQLPVSLIIITHFLHLQDKLAILVEPSRGRDPLSQSHNFYHQVGQRDGIEKDQRPRRRRDIEDCPPPAVFRGKILVDVDSDGVCRRRRRHVAPTVLRVAVEEGGRRANLGSRRLVLICSNVTLAYANLIGWGGTSKSRTESIHRQISLSDNDDGNPTRWYNASPPLG